MKTIFPLKIYSVLALFEVIFISSALCQEIKVTGFVKDIFNHPISGAVVKVKGTKIEVKTDSTGYFQCVSTSKCKILIEQKGFVSQKLAVKGDTQLDVTMLPDLKKQEDEEVNIGYGTVKKSDLTQSVSSASKTAVEQAKATGDIGELFTKFPGVEVMRSGGEIKLRIRGIKTFLGSSDPLIIVDGMPYSGSLNSLNCNDIKSVDVLKDAAATSIYGSQGANGVILITTKH
jgi:TonB-dependent starch-binding outer membrane protein SusC